MNSTLDSFCSEFRGFYNYEVSRRPKPRQQSLDGRDIPLSVWIIVAFLWVSVALKDWIPKYIRKQETKESKRVGPITYHPIIPISHKSLEEYKGSLWQDNPIPEARIYCSDGNEPPEKFSFKKYFTDLSEWDKPLAKVDGFLRDAFFLKTIDFGLIPENTRIVSVPNDGFRHGKEPHEFEKIDEGGESNGYYCWQMFGNNRIQATYFMEGDVRHVAGFVIYIENCSWMSGNVYSEDVIKELCEARKKPDQKMNFYESYRSLDGDFEPNPDVEMTVKYCKKIKRHVVSYVRNELLIHQEWESFDELMIRTPCQECTKEMMKKDEEEEPPAYTSLEMV